MVKKKSDLICSSCRTEITNLAGSVHFKCPACGKVEIVRCPHCRDIVARYTCKECGFNGPN